MTVTNARGLSRENDALVRIIGNPDDGFFGPNAITLSQLLTTAGLAVDDQANNVTVAGGTIREYPQEVSDAARVGLIPETIVSEDTLTDLFTFPNLPLNYHGGRVMLYAYRTADGANVYFGEFLFRMGYYDSDSVLLAEFPFASVGPPDISFTGAGTAQKKIMVTTASGTGETKWRGMVVALDGN